MKNIQIDEKSSVGMRPDVLIELIAKVRWYAMVNDIEVYQKIREFVVSTFKVILYINSVEVRVFIQNQISKIEALGYIYDFDEMEDFLNFSCSLSDLLLKRLYDEQGEGIDESYSVAEQLDKFLSINKKRKYSENNLNEFVGDIQINLKNLSFRLEKLTRSKSEDDLF